MSFAERFWEKVDKSGDCWLWLGIKVNGGYGQLKQRVEEGGTKNISAHRFSYQSSRGKIPKHLTLDHLCRNRSCVNPAHLEPVTRAENVMRGEGLAARYARRTHCDNGHPFDAENTRIETSGGRRCKVCANERARAEVSFPMALASFYAELIANKNGSVSLLDVYKFVPKKILGSNYRQLFKPKQWEKIGYAFHKDNKGSNRRVVVWRLRVSAS